MKTKRKPYKTTTLTPAKKKFAREYAKTDNGTQAILRAFPEITSPASARVKASRLLTNDNIKMEIQYQKNAISMLASRAVNRIGTLIESDDEAIAGTNSRWVYEQVHGKAVQKSTSLNVNFTQHIDNQGYEL